MQYGFKTLLISFITFVLLCGSASAGTYIVNPQGSSDQNVINQALNSAHQDGGGTVYLSAGVYTIDGPMYIWSNTKLTGDPDTIIRVSTSSSQWFQGSTGIISCKESLKNVEICSFSIDGNIENLPWSYSDSRADTSHDCEKLMILGGYSNDFAENIKIHDMKLYNSFSDGIYLRYTTGETIYNNIISNCQHEGIFLTGVTDGLIFDNKIAGIVSDCCRIDMVSDVKFMAISFSHSVGIAMEPIKAVNPVYRSPMVWLVMGILIAVISQQQRLI